jgi:hypothetical protein
MTRDDILRFAYLSKITNPDDGQIKFGQPTAKCLEQFANLVAAAERKWVGLTDEEFNHCLVGGDPCENLAEPEAWAVMKEVEAKLKEKNSG